MVSLWILYDVLMLTWDQKHTAVFYASSYLKLNRLICSDEVPCKLTLPLCTLQYLAEYIASAIVAYPSKVQKDYFIVTAVIAVWDWLWIDGILLILICCEQGMGEPLNNYSAVVDAIRAMTALPFQLSLKKITLSTVHTIYSYARCFVFILFYTYLFLDHLVISKLC